MDYLCGKFHISTFMKKYLCFLFFTVFAQTSFSQRIYSVVFDNLPQEFQLFPRNDKNLGTISVSGVIEVPDWSYMSVILLREDVKISYSRANFVYPQNSNVAPFKFPDMTIKAEPAEYECQVYACKGGDSVLMVSRKHLVAGDFYIISGQSNATAYNVGNVPYTYKNKYIRTFGLFSNGLNLSTNDTLWNSPDARPPYVGAWGLQIQRQIIENDGIPTCFINGAVPGAFISNHLQRDVNNPSNIGTLYGSLLQRVIKAKALNYIKAFIWFHGEGDILSSSLTYPEDFTKLYSYWKTDYPSISKFVVFQNNIHLSSSRNGAYTREFQRRTPSLFPDIITYAVNGASGFDGNHHSREGYIQIGNEVYGLLSPLFYNGIEKTNLHSPNLQQAYFNNQNHTSITLEFDKNQEMTISTDTTVKGKTSNNEIIKKVQDYFFFDNDPTKIAKIKNLTANDNRVIINFDEPVVYSKICYLPHSFFTLEINFFIGPCLKNTNGRRAFTFYNVPIGNERAPQLDSPVLTKNIIYFNEIKLKWSTVNNASKYIIERKSGKGNYAQVINLDSLTTEWSDKGLQANTEYTYRIKAQNVFLESDYSSEQQVLTPSYLSDCSLSSKIESLNQIKLSWLVVPNSLNYVLEKSIDNKPFSVLIKLPNQTTEYLDKDISFGTIYNYRIKAIGNQSESKPSITSLITPKELEIPLLKVTAVNKNTLNIQWKKSVGAKLYLLERTTLGNQLGKIFQLDSSSISFVDKDLIENTTYYYKIKAIGNFTESKVDTISLRTPAILSTPELTAEIVTHENIKLKWKAVTNANKYLLERKAESETTFQKVFETGNVFEYLDVKLKENSSYSYRLKAFSNVSESGYVKIDSKTLSILSFQSEANYIFKVFPNPSSEQLNILFAEPMTGNLSIVDLLGKTVFELSVTKQKNIEINVSSFKMGIYFVLIKTNQELYSQKVIIE